MDESISAPGGDFNLVPYESVPYEVSQPPRLAALAAMFGLSAPDVTRCRVLELGCAAGGNIIPLAMRFPHSQFVGIDLTDRHVRDGRARAKALRLKNIRIDQGDIAAVNPGRELYDYILCHGVYSWVPEPVREAILRLSAEHLSANGVAYVSYNVYPGWHMSSVTRDLILHHAGTGGEPERRIAKARWILGNIAKSLPGGTPYNDCLRLKAKELAARPDWYILSDYLGTENAPCYFRDFAAKARAHGLIYLCESELNECFPENLSAHVAATVRLISRDNLISLEQNMDFFKGRTFRQTLLVKAARETKIRRKLVPDKVRGLYVSGRLTSTHEADGSFKFTNAAGLNLTTRNPEVRDALRHLSDAFPSTRSVGELVAEAGASTRKAILKLEPPLLDAVCKLILAGAVNVSAVPLPPSQTISDKPKAWPPSRLDGLERRNWTTSRAHSYIALDDITVALLPFLDGSHDRRALQARLLQEVREGRVRLTDDASRRHLVGKELEAAAIEHVNLALNKLAAAGVLE